MVRRYPILFFFITIVYLFIFFTLNVARYNALFSFEWEDEATENQIVWNTAHGNFFYQSISDGYFYGHFIPFYFILSLGYKIIPHIFMWYFLSIFGLALSSIIIYKLAYLAFDNRLKSFLIALLFLLYPPIHYIALGPIDTITFFIPLFLLSFYFFKKNKFLYFMIFIVFAISCKESVALIVIMFSIYAMLCKKEKKWSVIPLLLGLFWFTICIFYILPYLSGAEFNLKADHYQFRSLDKDTFYNSIKFIVSSPREFLALVFSKEHILLLLRLILPFCFIPLLSIVTFIGIPGFLQLLLIKGPLPNENSYYISNVVPFLFLGYIYGLDRLNIILDKFKIRESIKKRFNYFIISFSLLASGFFILGENILGQIHNDYIYDNRFSKVRNIFDPIFYEMDDDDRIAWSMIKMIPQEASVSASGDLLIPLSHRKKLLEFGFVKTEYDYFNVDYILLNKRNMYHGAGHYEEIKTTDLEKLKLLVNQGKFIILSERGDFVLLKNVNAIYRLR